MTHAPSRAPTGSPLVVAAVCSVAVMMPLSFTGPSVALPVIGRDLGGDVVALGWVMNAFILAFGASFMAGGTLADRYGRKRMFRIGTIAFAITSLALGFAPNIFVLDILRGAQGLSAALCMSGGVAALAHEFDGAARTRALSLLGTSFGIGLAFGPIWSGFLIGLFGWPAMFWTGVVVAAFVLVFGIPRLHESRDPGAARLDVQGTASFALMLLFLNFGIVEGPQRGWYDPLVVGLLAAAVIAFVTFLKVERSQARPMLDLSLFRYPRFVGVQALPVAVAYSFVVPVIFLPIRFIGIEGMSPVSAGLMMMPLCAPVAIVPFLAGLLTRWVAAGTLSSIGLLGSAAGLVWLANAPPGAPALDLALPMLLIGIGAGVPWGLMDDLAIGVVPRERAGMATGIFGTMRVAGEAIALAIIGAVLVGLIQAGLEKAVAAGDGRLPGLANELANGSLARAAAIIPTLPKSVLALVYGNAFSATLHVLAAITAVAAVAGFFALRRAGRPAPATESLPACPDTAA
ncbi:MFS transporter [Segnochrobactrum spirostomi]|uniref:MFS transporter n=1 Tax=Segnochrobactrum spirostomi TaxID=2608987 RepID=A0A6A7Y2G8_9HYPH|nr:MFS transporter [Segnochrobactrum spirostomi]MQT13233.1 MFS transporter [Segnochrobactrum spirostomi]